MNERFGINTLLIKYAFDKRININAVIVKALMKNVGIKLDYSKTDTELVDEFLKKLEECGDSDEEQEQKIEECDDSDEEQEQKIEECDDSEKEQVYTSANTPAHILDAFAYVNREIYVSQCDELIPSINQYIDVLKSFNLKLTNMKTNKIPIKLRKQKAFKIIIDEIFKLDGDELNNQKKNFYLLFKPIKNKK